MCLKELYKRYWTDFNEPLTNQTRRVMLGRPVEFWLITGVIATPFFATAGFFVWFIPHLLGAC